MIENGPYLTKIQDAKVAAFKSDPTICMNKNDILMKVDLLWWISFLSEGLRAEKKLS